LLSSSRASGDGFVFGDFVFWFTGERFVAMSMVFAPCLTETAAPTTHAQPAWSPYDNNGG